MFFFLAIVKNGIANNIVPVVVIPYNHFRFLSANSLSVIPSGATFLYIFDVNIM